MKRLFVFLFVVLSFSVNAEELIVKNKVSYVVDVAKTIEQKQKGLMFVKELPLNKGMLFDVRDDKNVSMWMKNTYIPLDMIFLSCDFIVVDVYKNAQPYSLESIRSDTDFCFVLEVNGGDFDKYELKLGDRFGFEE
jgi:uncharacterized membrane protein (UPF0127 family)